MAAGFAALVSCGFGYGGIVKVVIGTAAIGAGYALAIPGFIALSLAATPKDRRGWTGAQLTMAAFLGQFLSPFASMPAISRWGWTASGLSLAAGLTMVAALALFVQCRHGRAI